MKIATTSTNQPVALNEDGSWQYLEPSGSALHKLQELEQSAEVVTFFKGLFNRVGIEVVDSNERVTCIHRVNEISFEEGIDEEAVDFCVRVYAYQIDRFIANVKTGYRDPLAHFRLMREFFGMSAQGGRSLLNNPIVTNAVFRKLINAKNLLHVHLLSPDKNAESDATYTLFFVNGSWNLAQGLVGEPDRIFRLSTDDALDLHRHVFVGTRDTKLTDVPKLAKWYTDWRSRVEAEAA
jgi:hypothetical protein